MNNEQVTAFLLQLPGVREDLKWGDNRVFSIKENKMVAVLNFMGEGLAFKVDKDLFLGYVDRPGVRPAPYLARAQWIRLDRPEVLSSAELQDLLTRSHQLVVRKLPKIHQIGLLLDPEQR
ncbi:MmcQ/YjbR family DNA-binding protein [Pseudomonas turukhanskensis]|uniref:MmcQ/YjbR family DNA-binding protein n=1 Tax=Pseudomonas turukhanskensis TaxID=1806536 RepID=A0A9W6NFI0_9PSED|nr:MmcQ/YjbR family DNA-binding protein [Pseudomonas turukhanskensis]GLK88825.1 hypothetical protein GCM10017655_18870 [Pseudomonas turukhanskensis]